MDLCAGEMKGDDRPPFHVDGGMELDIFFGAEGAFHLLPWFVELSDAKSSCIDGNVLSLFLNAMDNFPFSNLRYSIGIFSIARWIVL
jgi:hypothetical protein